jgi:5-methylcytosine-specific restriction protein A
MAQRARIHRRDKGLCQECLRQGRFTGCSTSAPVDHIVPRERGGSDHDSNLQLLCPQCHDDKSAREAAERFGRG